MSILKPYLPHMPGEPAGAFASRLAAFHIGDVRSTFLADVGLDRQKITDGDEDAIAALAEVAGVPLAHLANATVRRTSKRGFRLGEETFPRNLLRRSHVHVCPTCLRQDHAGSDRRPEVVCYQRVSWEFAPIMTCPVHHVALVKIAHAALPSEVGDFASAVREAWPDIVQLGDSALRRPPSPLESYVGRRIDDVVVNGGTGGVVEEPIVANDMKEGGLPWLARWGLYALTKACEMIGAVMLYGTRPNLKTLTNENWRAAGAVGFPLVAAGADAIHDWLGQVHKAAVVDDGHSGPQHVFGRLYQYLAFGDDAREAHILRGILREYVISNFPIGPGEIVLGKPVDHRRLHSVHTLHRQTELHPKRLRKLLVDQGLVDVDDARSDNLLVFPAKAAEPLTTKIVNALSLKQVETYLNCPRVHTKLLETHGFISPVVNAEHRGRLAKHAFDTASLDDFLERLLKNATPVREVEDHFHTIPKAAKRACCSGMEIVRLVLDGRLNNLGRDPEVQGYLSLLVDVDELRPLVQLKSEPEGVSLRDAERRIGTSTAVIEALIRSEESADPILESQTVINPVNRCPQIVIPFLALEDFDEVYVGLIRLAKEIGVHHVPLRRNLDDAGVEPAFDPDKVGARFYRRADIARVSDLDRRAQAPQGPPG